MFRRIPRVLAVSAALTLTSSALAVDYAFVVNQDERELAVIDMFTEQVIDHWRTDRNPRAATTTPNGELVLVAANHDLTILDVRRPNERIDVEFPFTGLTSTDVTTSLDGRHAFVSQRSNDQVARIRLDSGTVADCVQNHVKDCSPGSALVYRSLPFAGGEHVTTNSDGSIWLVNIDGRIARASSPAGSFQEISVPSGHKPTFPGGMEADDSGNVYVTTGNCTSGAAGCVKKFTASGSVSEMPFSLPRAGGLAIDTSDPWFDTIVVALPDDHAIARLYPAWGSWFRYKTTAGVGPVDVAVSPRGGAVTANSGNDTFNVVWPGGARWAQNPCQPNESCNPVSVAMGPTLASALSANTSPSWTYSSLFTWRGRRTIVLTSDGPGYFRVKDVKISGFDHGNFAILRDECTNKRLIPGETCEIDVDFRAGAYSGGLRLNTHTYRASVVLTSTHGDTSSVGLEGKHWSSGWIPRFTRLSGL